MSVRDASIRTSLRRAAAAFQLGPRTFLSGIIRPVRPDAGELEDVDRLSGIFGPPPTAPASSRHVLLLSYQAIPYSLKLEAVMARTLQDRGWQVSVLASPATEPFATAYHGRLLGAPVHCLEDYVSLRPRRDVREQVEAALAVARRSLAEFKGLKLRDAPLPLHALATLSAARPDGMVQADEDSLLLLGRLLRRSLLLMDGADALFAALRPTLALGIEKGFVGTCEAFYTALSRRTDYVQWFGCHEPEAIMLKRYRRGSEREHPFSISDANWAELRQAPWSDAYLAAVMGEFERGYKTGAWFKYKSIEGAQQFPERHALEQRLGLDREKKTAVIYSHILNDANLFYGNDLFTGGYEEWLVETVRAAAQNPSVNWVLKIHPANALRNARLGYTGEFGELLALKRAFGRVPEFLHVVSPKDDVSPLAFFGLTDWGVTVRGTVGLELPCFGVPVVTAGTGRYSGKGFTVDSDSPEQYLARLRDIHRIPPLTEAERRLGVRYAYNVFTRRPARYGEVLGDTYPVRPDGQRTRNLEMKVGTLGELLGHRRMKAIAEFLEAPGRDDFLEEARDA
jgi:hypothetical protein